MYRLWIEDGDLYASLTVVSAAESMLVGWRANLSDDEVASRDTAFERAVDQWHAKKNSRKEVMPNGRRPDSSPDDNNPPPARVVGGGADHLRGIAVAAHVLMHPNLGYSPTGVRNVLWNLLAEAEFAPTDEELHALLGDRDRLADEVMRLMNEATAGLSGTWKAPLLERLDALSGPNPVRDVLREVVERMK